MKTPNPSRFNQAIAHFDALNKLDPNLEIVSGESHPKELLYAQRMTEMLNRFAPDASEILQLAVRCQHIQRWKIPRASYPMTKAGYHQWRNQLKTFHANIAQSILQDIGYDEYTTSRVCSLIRKDMPHTDVEAQALENIVVLVFLESYLKEFVSTHSDYETSKFEDILKKSLLKMSTEARSLIPTMIQLPQGLEAIIQKVSNQVESEYSCVNIPPII